MITKLMIYRDDQNARGGFACPCIERELLRIGVDPNRRNHLGLCWNDVARLNGKGDFLFRDSAGLHRGQVPYISDEDFKSLSAR